MRPPHVVAFGGGVDSTAMVIGLVQRNEPIDLILFADTGGERPETYNHIETFSAWLKERGYPGIITVWKVKDGERLTLEKDCLDHKGLPSIAYGFKRCSDHFKIRPQNIFLRNWQPAIDAWEAGLKVVKYIGYDAGETRRKENADKRVDNKYEYRYPLIEWDWEREECLKTIAEAGVPNPGKSACFFCPSSRPKEVVDLYEKHPNLLERALQMEANADLRSIKGLGRQYAWRDVIWMHKAQMDLPFGGFEKPCECTE
jgi:hypothetical protein